MTGLSIFQRLMFTGPQEEIDNMIYDPAKVGADLFYEYSFKPLLDGYYYLLFWTELSFEEPNNIFPILKKLSIRFPQIRFVYSYYDYNFGDCLYFEDTYSTVVYEDGAIIDLGTGDGKEFISVTDSDDLTKFDLSLEKIAKHLVIDDVLLWEGLELAIIVDYPTLDDFLWEGLGPESIFDYPILDDFLWEQLGPDIDIEDLRKIDKNDVAKFS